MSNSAAGGGLRRCNGRALVSSTSFRIVAYDCSDHLSSLQYHLEYHLMTFNTCLHVRYCAYACQMPWPDIGYAELCTAHHSMPSVFLFSTHVTLQLLIHANWHAHDGFMLDHLLRLRMGSTAAY
ncbi:TPA: hypothetical protein ACH3X1_009691 [Trebouxia sp. C0004]